MKKKLLSMLTLMTLCISGAWAETVVTNPATEMVDGTYITMQCMDTNGGDEYYFNGNTTKSEALSFANIYKIVSNGADAFYLQRVSDSKYVGNSSNNVTMVDEASAAAAFTFSIATAANWTTYDNTKYTNGTSTVRFTNGSVFLNTRAKDGVPGYAAGTGGYSIWYVKTYTQNEVDKMNPELLTFSEVKDGYTYALVNVQPTNSVGKNYYLNSTDGNLTPVDATGFNNASEWPTTAQFVAIKQADGKYAFKNVENGMYLAWKGGSGGENGNKGFVSTVELWSAWTMNKSTRAGWTETYWPSTSKRTSTNSTVGTLLIANNGSWNAANTEWTTSAYSNNYGFVELAAPTMPTVEFNYILSFEGQTKIIPVSGRVGDAMPTVAIPAVFTATMPTGTIAEDQADVTITLTLKDGVVPFQYFEQGSAISQWYTLKMRDNYWMKYSATGDARFPLSTTEPSANDNARLFGFVGNPLTGFKIVSYAEGTYQYVTATTGNNSTCGATANEAEGTILLYEVNSGHKVFKVDGNAYLNAIASSTKLGVWNHTAAATDGGSTFTFAEADVTIFDLDTYKAEVIAALPNVPALFSSTDITTATNAINAVTCGADDESINAAKATIATAVDGLYATAAGKKFTYKSTMYNTVRYLAAPVAAGALTTTENVNRYNVFELVYVSGADFKVKACSVDAYLNSTNTAAEGSIYNFIYQGQENYISLQFNGTANALHHQEYGHAVVSWDTNSNASKWYVATVTDEEWAAMTALPDVTALQTLINNTRAGYYDDWNGVWRIGAGLNNYNYITEPAEGMDLQTYLTTAQNFIDNLSSDNTDEEVAEITANLNSIIANLAINQPADGSFLRIRSVKAGMGYVNAETTTAHDGCLAVGGQKASSIFYYKDGKLLSYTEGQYIIKNNSGSGFAALGATGAEGAAIAFGQATKQAGCYTVVYAGNRYLYAADNASNVDAGGSEGNNGYDFWLEEVTTLPVTITEAGLATLYAPVALEIPTKVNAYTMAVNGEYLQGAKIESGIIPANTGVVLEAETAGTYNFNITTGGEGESCLNGTIASIAAPENVYTLAKDGEDGLGFYKFAGETLGGFKAYYQGSSAEVKGFKLTFGDTETGIANVNGNDNDNMIYNLAGQRVQKLQKGINIVGGKKVLY